MSLTRRVFMGSATALTLAPGMARAQARSGILRYGLATWPPSLQPWLSVGSSAGTIKALIHRNLVGYGPDGELRGEIAESWSLDRDGAWVFKLRPNVLFHNGERATAEDVKWTIEQIAAPNSTAFVRTQFQQFERVETPDPLTVRIVTKEPLATLPGWFANFNVPMVWHRSNPDNPVGAGPFRLTGQERGTSLDFVPFDRYFRTGLPRLRGIRMVVYADENLRMAALMSGDVDMIEFVPWQSMATVEATPRLRHDAQMGPFMDILFNASKPPFDDPRVRRAVAHAVRREDIVKAAFFGRGKPLEGVPIVEGTPWYDAESARGWRYDPARSRELLAAAGHPNGFQTTLLATAQFGMHKDTAEVVQQHLAQIGIRCEMRLPDWNTRVGLGTRGQYDLAIHGVVADNNDPDGLTIVMDTSLAPAHNRSFGLSAPRTSAAFARGRAEFDQAKRVEIYRELQRAAIEEVPLVGLAWREQGFAMDRRVTGFVNLPGALTTSSGATLEQTAFG